MFGRRASIEPQRLWPCGEVAMAGASMLGCVGVIGYLANENEIEKHNGPGRWCG
jgi:hypothetical protein